jgi:hypothetical protein
MKRRFTLVEVLVAGTIGALVLTHLVWLYASIRQRESVVVQRTERVLEMARMREQLTQTLCERTAAPAPNEKRSVHSASHLFFSYDGGIDPDPAFCGICTGELFFSNGELILSKVGQGSEFKEVLATGLQGVRFALFKQGRLIEVNSAVIDTNVDAVVITCVFSPTREESITLFLRPHKLYEVA